MYISLEQNLANFSRLHLGKDSGSANKKALHQIYEFKLSKDANRGSVKKSKLGVIDEIY